MTNSKSSPYIEIKGAKIHNLKNIDVNIPRGKLVVITGVSGSGKSSLAFDTLYAEGQRRYVESLSSYARQFLARMNKPEVDYIKGIPPAVAIEQKVNTRNPHSTVGTSTELYEYMKLLYARIGKTYSPVTGAVVKKHSVNDVVAYFSKLTKGTRLLLMFPIFIPDGRTPKEHLNILIQQGYSRIMCEDEVLAIEELIGKEDVKLCKKSYVVLDRLSADDDDDTISRLSDSVETAFIEGQNECYLYVYDGDKPHLKKFSKRFEADGITFIEPTANLFSFNNPVGACPTCQGFGNVIGYDPDLIIPDKSKSVYDDAVMCWRGEKMSEWKDEFVYAAQQNNFPIHTPYYKLSNEQKDILWKGAKKTKGINAFFSYVESKQYKIQYRVMLARYRGKTTCPVCNGARLKTEAGYVKVGDKKMQELVVLPVSELRTFFDALKLNEHELLIAKRLLIEIKNRLNFLCDVGLGYLSVNRPSNTLSGGESQRINLATSLGSSLVGSMYILDEPSIGLHSRDTEKLIKVLKQLKALGNTVIVVEHDEDIIRQADYIIDIGPLAGRNGGEVVFEGTLEQLINANSLTTHYLTGKEVIPLPPQRRKWNNYIEVLGASENNLQNLDVRFPLNIMTVVTGVSGSGKSSLVKKILYPALKKLKEGVGEKTGSHALIQGDVDMIYEIEFVDQNPIGKSSRSNPVTYLKAYDEIRALFSSQHSAKINGLKPAHFSFNVDGGRCDECQGEGFITVEMQFMANITMLCESCKGHRFKDAILEIKYREKSIFDILEMTVSEAIEFFTASKGTQEKKIVRKLQPLKDVGLGYVKLGQSSNTLSGGESQRVKLAFFLSKEKTSPTLFIFDEPTTGLHFHDIKTLLEAFNALIHRGHTVLIIEHNPDVIKCADWIIDLGPEGGDKGGFIVAEGTPEQIIKNKSSFTGKFLSEKIE